MDSPLSSQDLDQAAAAVDRHDPHLRIHAIKIFVRDQDQSLRFYVDQLGFEVAFDARLQSGDRWVAVAPPDGHRFAHQSHCIVLRAAPSLGGRSRPKRRRRAASRNISYSRRPPASALPLRFSVQKRQNDARLLV